MVYTGEGSTCVLEQCVFSCLRVEHSMMCKLGQVGYSVFEIFYECPDFFAYLFYKLLKRVLKSLTTVADLSISPFFNKHFYSCILGYHIYFAI